MKKNNFLKFFNEKPTIWTTRVSLVPHNCNWHTNGFVSKPDEITIRRRVIQNEKRHLIHTKTFRNRAKHFSNSAAGPISKAEIRKRSFSRLGKNWRRSSSAGVNHRQTFEESNGSRHIWQTCFFSYLSANPPWNLTEASQTFRSKAISRMCRVMGAFLFNICFVINL